MATIVEVRNKLVQLLENRKKLEHEAQLKKESFDKCKAERIKVEAERVEKYSDLLAKERKLEELSNQIKENEEKIAELEKSAEECQRTSELLTSKIDQKDEIIINLQSKAEEAQSQTQSCGKTYSETLDRFRDIQVAHERIERREAQLQRALLEMEQDKAVVEYKLKKLQTSGEQASARQEELTKAIEACNERLKVANQRAAEAEVTYEGLSVELSLLEEEATDWTVKARSVREQLETVRTSMQPT